MEREISIILKVRGARQAKKAVMDVFDGQTKTLVEGFNKNTKKTGDNMDRVAKTSKRAGRSMSSFTKVLGRGMAALYLYNRAWQTFGRNFEQGLQLERASEQFDRHVGNVTKMLPELRVATRGLIADFDLLKTANRAFQQGIQPERMGKTFSLAISAAQKLGLESREAIKTITDAITTQNEGSLKTLGIITNVNQAYQTQAALIAKNGGVMSKAMSIRLRQSLIMQELQKRFGGVNRAQEDNLQVLERFRASWKNFRAEIGQTLGIALVPLTRALTGVLDVTTALLNRLNDTSGFQKFIQMSATLAGIWGGMKFISGARAILSVLGMFSGGRVSKMPRWLAKTNVLMGKFGKVVATTVPVLGRFSGWLTNALKMAPAFARLIPGWGTAISAVLMFMDPLISAFKTAWTAGKVFFQLLSGFNRETGLSRVLRKDAEELGVFYNWVENSAKIALEFWAVIKGIGQGVSQAFSPIGDMISWVGTQLEAFGIDLFSVDKIAARSTSRLDALTEKVRGLVKWLGLGASAVAMFIPGLQGVGLAGASIFGGSLINDAIQGNMGFSPQPAAQDQRVMQGFTGLPMPGDQTSTQRGDPAPRQLNLESAEDPNETNKKILKILEKQTGMMEVENQKKDIEKSQTNARNNIWMRR